MRMRPAPFLSQPFPLLLCNLLEALIPPAPHSKPMQRAARLEETASTPPGTARDPRFQVRVPPSTYPTRSLSH